MRKLMIALAASAAFAGETPVKDAGTERDLATLAVPETLIIAADIPAARRAAMLASARKFYQFWSTGDEDLLRQTISDRLRRPPLCRRVVRRDRRTCRRLQGVPRCRPGSEGRRCSADPGRRPGRLPSALPRSFHRRVQPEQGKGPIEFSATDILAVRAGKITDNWHLEDNLTFLQQIGLAAR